MSNRCSRVTAALAVLSSLSLTGQAFGQQGMTDPLPSWNDGPAKRAILEFVRVTTDKASPRYVPPERRIATFDQDGTLWVEQPLYTQVMFAIDRVKALVPEHPAKSRVGTFSAALMAEAKERGWTVISMKNDWNRVFSFEKSP